MNSKLPSLNVLHSFAGMDFPSSSRQWVPPDPIAAAGPGRLARLDGIEVRREDLVQPLFFLRIACGSLVMWDSLAAIRH